MLLTLTVPATLKMGGRNLESRPARDGVAVVDVDPRTSDEVVLGHLRGNACDPDEVAQALVERCGFSASRPIRPYERETLSGVRTWLGCLNRWFHETSGSKG